MSRREQVIDASPEAVWATLADGTAFQDWVAGCKEVRYVEGAWPEVGSAIHHSVGIGPATIDDTTTVEELAPQQRLVLRARIRPAGVARVVLTLQPEPDGKTTVVMEEEMTEGPASVVPDVVADPLLDVRNAESLRRLKNLAERRA